MNESRVRRIVFKCDFGGANGWGHVIRCSALASEFKKRGWVTVLWSYGSLSELPLEVAEAFKEVTREGTVESAILLIDEMYTEQSSLEALIIGWRSRNPNGIVAGIDDMQTRSMHGFDLVVNTEIGLERSNYEAPVALLGERYALLRPGFRNPSVVADISEFGSAAPVLVMMGGTDVFAFLPRVLEALSRIDGVEIAPIVIGSASDASLKALEIFPGSRVLNRLDSARVAGWMAFCRFGIIGCGTSLYEAAAMGLPFLGLSMVDNQTSTARRVKGTWEMPILYREENQDAPLDLAVPVLDLLKRKREKYSKVGTSGAKRVCGALEVLCR